MRAQQIRTNRYATERIGTHVARFIICWFGVRIPAGALSNLFADFINQVERFASTLNVNYLKASSLHHSSKL
ncbi:MAG: hypothetical protein V7638_2851 [Acidobacteriota bacterium]